MDTGSASDAPSGPMALPEGRLEGRQVFSDLVRAALATAAREGWSQLVLCDADFEDWPLGEKAVVDALQSWADRGRQIRFIAHDFGPLRLKHPRLVQWRTTWSHLVDARACARRSGQDLPSAIWSPHWTLERIDPVRCTLIASNDAKRRTGLKERLDNCWDQGSPSFPSTTLGL